MSEYDIADRLGNTRNLTTHDILEAQGEIRKLRAEVARLGNELTRALDQYLALQTEYEFLKNSR